VSEQTRKEALLATRCPWKSSGSVEQRLDAIEAKVEELQLCYLDLVGEYCDNFLKRIDLIRDEVNRIENRVYGEASQKIAESLEGLRKVVEEARQSLRHELITKDVISALTDGSHVLLTRHANWLEQKDAIPVKHVR
jgi:Mg2+ and Co2+ transporter CorA